MPAAAQPSNDRLRQIAILVSSVDAATARQLLLHLPTDTAKRVRSLAAKLGPITAEEKRRILSDFQKSAGNPAVAPSQADATPSPSERQTAASPSAPRSESSTPSTGQPNPAEPPEPNAWTRLSIEALLRFVRAERPAVVAVVVSQLAPEVAVQVLQHLPHAINRDVLTRLSRLQEIDGEAMRAIDEYLSERLTEYQHKLESEDENKRRIKALLSAAPLALREQWERVFEDMDHDDSAALSSASPGRPSSSGDTALRPQSPLSSSAQSTGASHSVSQGHAFADDGQALDPTTSPSDVQTRTVGLTPLPSEQARASQAELAGAWIGNEDAADDHSMRDPTDTDILPFRREEPLGHSPEIDYSLAQLEFEQILELEPQRLAGLLSRAEAKTVLLALAGATPRFMERFYDLLMPSDAHALRDRLQRLGKIQLRDVDAAQRRIVELSLADDVAQIDSPTRPTEKRSKQAA